ncbi:protein of unknown function DUF81 [Thermodesulfobium narugense DSM 14796]|uniref:Probable membrane transporter protein n=1 Tax=Thermodesulfobium narugense DSM 14796 TaxID=747365 RepID=M1E846_9BACT|nr:sulfite exporter TauE/SafE family protein [Thermodesulfobium narugense]AEE14953.1 protein of unknown function DUF81 [Thermodesulfobium narugense DSM 14796]
MKEKLKFIIFGILGGLASGLLGIGGGLVFVPLLTNYAEYSQKEAHATSLGAIIPAGIAGALIYNVNGLNNLADSIYLALGGILGAQIGSRAMYKFSNKWLRKAFGVFLLLMSIRMVLK